MMTPIKRNALIAVVSLMTGSMPSFVMAASSANKSSLLSSTELDGGALLPEDSVTVIRSRRVNTAMLASLKAQDQIRRVEIFLKSGPAQSGDLRVVQAGKPDSAQK